MKNRTEFEISFELFVKDTEQERSISLTPGVYKAKQELIADIAIVVGKNLCYIGIDQTHLEYLHRSAEIHIITFHSDTGSTKDRITNLYNS